MTGMKDEQTTRPSAPTTMNTAGFASSSNQTRLNTVDIVTLAVIAIVFGVLAAFWQTIYLTMSAVFGPLGSGIVAGFVSIPAILAPYIIRKPGVAVLAEIISVFGQVIAGNPLGVVVLVYGILQGVPAELVFAATRYKRWNWSTLIAAGALSQAGSWVGGVVIFSFYNLPAAYLLGLLIAQMISGAILAGVVSKLIGDGLARTRVLDNFRIETDSANA